MRHAALHVPLPGFRQDILMARLYACWWYLRHIGLRGGHFYTHSQPLIKMWHSGPARCCDAFSAYSGIWRAIWAILDDVGPMLVTASWITGHATAARVSAGLVTEWQRRNNGIVDGYAKAGAALHSSVGRLVATVATRAKALEWVTTYIGLAHARYGSLDWWMLRRGVNKRERSEQLLHAHRGGYARAKAVTDTSRLEATAMSSIFCVRCGGYADARWQGLARVCRGVVPSHAVLTRDQLL
jgi:hypothetical protein